MTKEDIRDRLSSGETPKRGEIYAMMDTLGLTYRRTGCKKCLADYLAIIREEVGLISDASMESGFDAETKWAYLKDRDYQWKGYRLNADTPSYIVRAFMTTHPRANEFYAPVQAVPEETTNEADEAQEITTEKDTQENEQ